MVCLLPLDYNYFSLVFVFVYVFNFFLQFFFNMKARYLIVCYAAACFLLQNIKYQLRPRFTLTNAMFIIQRAKKKINNKSNTTM